MRTQTTLSGPLISALIVYTCKLWNIDILLSGGTATPGEDFVGGTTAAYFQPGEDEADAYIQIYQDYSSVPRYLIRDRDAIAPHPTTCYDRFVQASPGFFHRQL